MIYPTNPTGYFNIPEPSLDEPEPVIIEHCCKCGGEIYQDEPTVCEDGRRMHMDCFEEYIAELLRTSPAIVAECMGMRYEEGEID